MTDSEVFSKVNNRRFQEDYIADYIEYLWTISPIGKHGQTDPVRTVQIDPFKTA